MKIFLFCLTIFLMVSCDHGIKPADGAAQKTAISGTIYYNNWPPADSVKNLKLVVFKSFPPNDILSEVIAGTALAYPVDLVESLPIEVDSTFYEMELDAGIYEYVVVAQQFGMDVFSDWRAVGQYDLSPADSLPSAVAVIQDSVKQKIDIHVDFDNLPIQPFEKP